MCVGVCVSESVFVESSGMTSKSSETKVRLREGLERRQRGT